MSIYEYVEKTVKWIIIKSPARGGVDWLEKEDYRIINSMLLNGGCGNDHDSLLDLNSDFNSIKIKLHMLVIIFRPSAVDFGS